MRARYHPYQFWTDPPDQSSTKGDTIELVIHQANSLDRRAVDEAELAG